MAAVPTNRRVVLTRIPKGMPCAADFALEEAPAGAPAPGQVLLRTVWLSIDPYQRNWMAGGGRYGAPAAPGMPVIGRAVSEVLNSADSRLHPGDLVFGETGWQTHPVVPAGALERLGPDIDPPSAALGALGPPGLTAWIGIQDILQPRSGETVVVSAALGAVGSIAGQLARLCDARVVGVAGDPRKCGIAVAELGFHACVSRREPDFPAQLARACPEGIDAYFDNTGGGVTAAVYSLLRENARIALCGLVAEYGEAESHGPSLKPLLTKQASLRAFSVRQHLTRMPEYRARAIEWLRSGALSRLEHVVDGIEKAPRAFIDMLSGVTVGKTLVRVSPSSPGARPGEAHVRFGT